MNVAKTKADYHKLQADLEALERRLSDSMSGVFVYLQDECVDRENVLEDGSMTEDSEGFWPAMCSAAASAAGMRGEELGIDVNAELGRVIY